MTHEEALERATDDVARVLHQQGRTEIAKSEWSKMIADRMDVLMPSHPRYQPAEVGNGQKST